MKQQPNINRYKVKISKGTAHTYALHSKTDSLSVGVPYSFSRIP